MRTDLELVQELAARDNQELAARVFAARNPDLGAVWPKLEDDERDWLVQAGFVHEVEADVEYVEDSAGHWKDDWQTENGAAWPTYELQVAADGLEPLTLTGWHCVGYFSPDADHNDRHWDCRGDDWEFNGTPRVASGGKVRWVIESDKSHPIPCWRQDGQWVTLDRSKLDDALSDAADVADHGSEPTWEDVEWSDLDRKDPESVVWVVRNNRVESVDIYTGGVAGEWEYDSYGRGRGRTRHTMTYGAEAWSHELARKDETVWETRADVIADLKERADDETLYESEGAAENALAAVVAEMEPPDGLSLAYEPGETDEDGTAGIAAQLELILGDDLDDAEDSYTLDLGDVAAVAAGGWRAIRRLLPPAMAALIVTPVEDARERAAALSKDYDFGRMPVGVLADWFEERSREVGDEFETTAHTLRACGY